MFSPSSRHSTTRLLTREPPLLEKHPTDTFETILFLPKREERQGEGGLRTQGYFKRSLPDKPLITVITVVFNGAKHLEETILSVINQTYDNVEYIVIDGGSTDRTLDIIRQYEHAIDYWVSERDRGIYDAMNKGINLSADSDFLYFLGDDDTLFNKKVIGNFFNKKINKNNDIIYGFTTTDNHIKVVSRFSYLLLIHNCLHHQAAFYKKKLFFDFRYDTKYKISADYELNLIAKITKKKVAYIDTHIATCRTDGVSTKKSNYFNHIIETNRIKRKVFKGKILLNFSNFIFWSKAIVYYVIRHK